MNSKHLSDLSQVQDGDVPFATFDGTDKGAVQLAKLTELLLRQTSRFPLFADPVPKSLQELFVVDARHS